MGSTPGQHASRMPPNEHEAQVGVSRRFRNGPNLTESSRLQLVMKRFGVRFPRRALGFRPLLGWQGHL